MAGLVSRLPTGVLLCTCRLVDCFRTDDVQCTSQDKIDTLGAVEGPWLYITEQEARFGDYSRGRYAWLLADVQPLKEPIPARGALGLWETDLL